MRADNHLSNQSSDLTCVETRISKAEQKSMVFDTRSTSRRISRFVGLVITQKGDHPRHLFWE